MSGLVPYSRPVCAVLAVMLLVLAGCAGKDEASVAGPAEGPQTAGNAAFDETTGALRGFILTIDGLEIPDADVLLQPGAHVTKTAQDGSYSFSLLAPGRYQVFATKLGFDGGLSSVDVKAGEASELDLQLAEIPILDPRSKVWGPEAGYIQCRASTPTSSGFCGFVPVLGDAGCAAPINNCLYPILWPNDKNQLRFQLEAEDWQQIVFEARWTPSTYATNPKMTQIFSYLGRPSTHWFANATPAERQLKFVFTHGKEGPGGQLSGNNIPMEPNLNLTLITWLTLPFGTVNANNLHPVNVAYEMRFDIMVTVFYAQDAPPEYSGFQDT